MLSVAIAACGVVMIVSAATGGGGPLSVGVVLGALFVVLGAGRLYMWRGRRG